MVCDEEVGRNLEKAGRNLGEAEGNLHLFSQPDNYAKSLRAR